MSLTSSFKVHQLLMGDSRDVHRSASLVGPSSPIGRAEKRQSRLILVRMRRLLRENKDGIGYRRYFLCFLVSGNDAHSRRHATSRTLFVFMGSRTQVITASTLPFIFLLTKLRLHPSRPFYPICANRPY
ncbi:unnamed protein product [Periconia digitata]|uniref:Uncharacterized protein n=1 Tax=Periconia digitata TaxID=1303443 RepID=A0A9W4UI85_9PLEO|nr:unnamed protein product [Periconia digitata]